MSNPTSSQPGPPAPRPGNLPPPSPARASTPLPVVYRYTQQFRQEWQNGPFPATWGPRLVAVLIDLVVIGVPFNLLYNFVFTFVPEDWLNIGLPPIGRELIFWLVFGLVTALTATWSGASPGKKLLNLKVAGPGNAPLSFSRFFLRETLVIYSLISLYQLINLLLLTGLSQLTGFNLLYLPGAIVGLGCLSLLLTPPRPTLHDRLFKTGVVIADPQKILAS